MERLWGIQAGVEEEWGHTFDKLVTYHNLPNESLKDTVKMIWAGKTELKERSKKSEINEKEMRNWIKPRLKPWIWKKYLWPSQYEREQKLHKFTFESLFGSEEFQIESDGPISKDQFMNGIINELREKNTEV